MISRFVGQFLPDSSACTYVNYRDGVRRLAGDALKLEEWRLDVQYVSMNA